MGFQPCPKTVSCELVFWNGQSYSENVLHFEKTTAWTQQDMTDLASDMRSWWSASIKGYCPPTIFLSKIIVKSLEAQDAPGIEYTAGMPLPGSSTGEAAPMSVTVAVKWLTGLRGRSYRGRSYHVGLQKSDLQGDKISAEMGSTLAQKYAELLEENRFSVGCWLVVVSRWTMKALRGEAVPTKVTSVFVDQTLDNQRRRLLTRGM